MLAESALAVDSEIVGRDNDGELICGDGEVISVCCCAAAIRAAVAVCVSVFDLGEGEKRLVNFFILGEDARRGSSRFSLCVVIIVVVVEGELFPNGFNGLRDMVGHVCRLSDIRLGLVEKVVGELMSFEKQDLGGSWIGRRSLDCWD